MVLQRIALVLIGLGLVGSACARDARDDGVITIVVTTTVLGDIASNVAGTGASVEVLVPLGVDPHEFRPSARQVAAMEVADLVIANGLELEEGLDDLLRSVEGDGTPVVRIGDAVSPLPFRDADDRDRLDPHVWMDPIRMVAAVELIGDELTRLAPQGPWAENADAYAGTLRALDVEVDTALSGLSSRLVVTNHDALGYFAARYDLEVIGLVVPGGSTLATPSSADLAALVEVIQSRGIGTIFGETTEPSTLAEAVAAEAGTDIRVVELYIGSLGGEGSGAETYVDLIRTDAALIAEALR